MRAQVQSLLRPSRKPPVAVFVRRGRGEALLQGGRPRSVRTLLRVHLQSGVRGEPTDGRRCVRGARFAAADHQGPLAGPAVSLLNSNRNEGRFASFCLQYGRAMRANLSSAYKLIFAMLVGGALRHSPRLARLLFW